MIKTIKTCDRCGEIITKNNNMRPVCETNAILPVVTGLYFAYRHMDPKPLDTLRIDLCADCMESLDIWFTKLGSPSLFDNDDFEESDNTDE